MASADQAADDVLQALLAHLQEQRVSAKDLQKGYTGPLISELRQQLSEVADIDFELALEDLESREFVDTGPKVPHENDPGSALVFLGETSKREKIYLTEEGYRAAQKLGSHPRKAHTRRSADILSEAIPAAIHPGIWAKCGDLYSTGAHAEAVEKSFKIVRDRLRALTKYETGADAFGKGGLYVAGAVAQHVEEDFNKGVQFLTMAIDRFRNEKSHTSDANMEDPIRAFQYMTLSSLALSLLEHAESKPKS